MHALFFFAPSHKKNIPPFPTGCLIHEVMSLYSESVIQLGFDGVWTHDDATFLDWAPSFAEFRQAM